MSTIHIFGVFVSHLYLSSDRIYRPTPSISEIKESTYSFCRIPWDQLQSQARSHKYTGADMMPHRCLQGLYLGILLQDAFGFDGGHTGITIALKVQYMFMHT